MVVFAVLIFVGMLLLTGPVWWWLTSDPEDEGKDYEDKTEITPARILGVICMVVGIVLILVAAL